MGLFWTYLKTRLGALALIAALCAVFLAVGWLSGMTGERIGYALLLCAAVTAVAAAADIRHFYVRHRELSVAMRQILVSLDNLPSAETQQEEDYREMAVLLHDDAVAALNADQLRYGELLDYFTLWAHQIKTPIAAMRLILQSDGEKYSAELEQELFRIEQYVEMVLTYLRLDSDYSDFVLRRCELDGIIKQAVRRYANQFIRKRISLVYEGTDALVLTDEKWLGFVMEQLLANALKYTNTGSIEIRADSRRMSVGDTGIGIAPEDLPRVFQKGYTGYNGRTDKKSTGIGLYLCRRILEKLGHTINIASEAGRGTTVTVDFGESRGTPRE